MDGDPQQPSTSRDSRSLDELLDVLRVSDQREFFERRIEETEETGRSVTTLEKALDDLPGVTGLEALKASRRVVDLLTSARWHMIRQAREEGSSWSQVGNALGMSKQAAFDFYRRKLEQQDVAPTARSRAALGAEPRD